MRKQQSSVVCLKLTVQKTREASLSLSFLEAPRGLLCSKSTDRRVPLGQGGLGGPASCEWTGGRLTVEGGFAVVQRAACSGPFLCFVTVAPGRA